MSLAESIVRTSPLAFFPLAAALLAAPSIAFAQPDEADRTEARRQFQSGVAQFQQRSFGPALEAFQTAYRIAPHPSVRKNMAFCLQELGREGEALEQFELYLSEAQAVPPAERRTIDQRIRALRARVSEVTLTITPADALSMVVTVDERVVSTARPVRVSAGHHQLRVAATGYTPLTRDIEATAGQPQTLTLTLEQEAPPPPPSPPPPPDTSGSVLVPPMGNGAAPLSSSSEDVAPPTGPQVLTPEQRHGLPPAVFYTVAGVTGAAAIAWAVCGALALSANSDYEATVTDVNGRAASDPAVAATVARGQDQAASASQLALWSDIAMGVTLLGAAAGTVLFFNTDFGGHRVNVSAAPMPHGGALSFGTMF